MRKILFLTVPLLSCLTHAQIKIEFDKSIDSYVVTSKAKIYKIEFTRIKRETHKHLKTVKPDTYKYIIPNKYFKYRLIRVSASTRTEVIITDFETPNKKL